MGRRLFLGIDTSNYTTSLAVASSGKVLSNLKLPLPVKEGECGLRQSDALFAHVKNIPMLADELRSALDGETPTAIGASAKPRNVDGSYMPCFLSGVAAAEAMGAALGVPVYHFSHQCGHLRAALYSAGAEALLARPFGAFHVSGGTTEMLLAHPKDGGFSVRLLGGTADLNAGQLVDRIGVMLGLRFPCGPALEQLATESPLPVKHKKITVKEGCVNLSGVENSAKRLFNESESAPLTAAFVLDYIGDALIENYIHCRIDPCLTRLKTVQIGL